MRTFGDKYICVDINFAVQFCYGSIGCRAYDAVPFAWWSWAFGPVFFLKILLWLLVLTTEGVNSLHYFRCRELRWTTLHFGLWSAVPDLHLGFWNLCSWLLSYLHIVYLLKKATASACAAFAWMFSTFSAIILIARWVFRRTSKVVIYTNGQIRHQALGTL